MRNNFLEGVSYGKIDIEMNACLCMRVHVRYVCMCKSVSVCVCLYLCVSRDYQVSRSCVT